VDPSLLPTCTELFHTALGTTFADILIDGHRETWPIRSRRFKAFLRRSSTPCRRRARSRALQRRVATRNTHGTGCTLSSAIAPGLAKGLDLIATVREAKAHVSAAIAAADRLTVGSGGMG
jgi:hydroxymethylpyrimidine/phosphomethylpyrimidine kinase